MTVGSVYGPEQRDIVLVVEENKSTVVLPYSTFQSNNALICPEDFPTNMCVFMMTGDITLVASEGGEGGEEPTPEPEPVAGWDGPKVYNSVTMEIMWQNYLTGEMGLNATVTLLMDVDVDGTEKVDYATWIVTAPGIEAPVNVCVPYVYDELIKVLTLKDVTFMSAQMQPKTVDVEFEVSDDKSELLLEEHPIPGGQVLSPDFPEHAYSVSLTTDITLVGQN